MVGPRQKTYTLTQAAQICGVSRVTLWRWIKSGKLTAYQTPTKHFRIKEHDLESFIEEHLKFIDLKPSRVKTKVLIVDDEPSFRNLVKRMLPDGEILVEEAGNGFEAGLKVHSFTPSILILDLYMQEMNGFEVCRMLKSEPSTRDIKIIAVTGMGSPEVEQQIRLLGANAYLEKPFQRQELMQCIKNLS